MQIVKYPSAIFVISQITGIPFKTLIEKTNKKPQAMYRQVLIWFLHYEGVTHQGIHEMTGRNRSTVIYSVRLIDDLIDVKDKETINLIDKINEIKNEWNDNSDRF